VPNPIDFSSNASTRAVWRKHETIEQAVGRRDTLVRQLQKGGASTQQLGGKLADCKGDRRCKSPICPMCVRELRYWFISEAIDCIEELRSTNRSTLDGKVVRFLGIPLEAFRFGTRSLPDLRQLNKTLKKRFERDRFPLVFAGVDFSLNLYNNSIVRARWQPHLYGLVVGLTSGQVKTALSAYYPPHKRAKKPLFVSGCNHLSAALSYCIKPYFSRHSGYRDRINGRKNSRPQPLKSWQIQELGVWLNQYELADRYLLRGCRKQGERIVINPETRAKLLGA
jgi:hypothetical protein